MPPFFLFLSVFQMYNRSSTAELATESNFSKDIRITQAKTAKRRFLRVEWKLINDVRISLFEMEEVRTPYF